ncbi:MAG: hypothetical protein ACRDZX_14480, partial [Acidimicrobiales bacterium]
MGGGRPYGAWQKGHNDELALLLRHERASGRPGLLSAILDLRSGDGPEPVREAAHRLLEERAPWALDLARPVAALVAAAGDGRDQRLFASWTLQEQRPTFEDLARAEGVCRQNVNRLVRQAESRVRAALAGAPPPLPWAVAAVRSQLGTVATQEQLATVLAGVGARKAPAGALIAWLAGPYTALPGRPGWVGAQPPQPAELLVRTVRCLAADGGVRRLEEVEAELADLGVSPGNFVGWLATNGAAVVHDLSVSVNGALAGAVERLLDAHGAPRSPDQLAADLVAGGRHADPEALASALRAPRFARPPGGPVSLASWGEGAQAAAKAVTTARAATARAAKRAPERHRPSLPTAGRRSPQAPPGDERGGGELLWLWVRVDGAVLRGAEAAVPTALVEGLGLAPLSRRTFSSRWGPVTLAHDLPQPTRGPVRAVALAAGARADDTLLLGFSASGSVDVEVRRGAGQAGPP